MFLLKVTTIGCLTIAAISLLFIARVKYRYKKAKEKNDRINQINNDLPDDDDDDI